MPSRSHSKAPEGIFSGTKKRHSFEFISVFFVFFPLQGPRSPSLHFLLVRYLLSTYLGKYVHNPWEV